MGANVQHHSTRCDHHGLSKPREVRRRGGKELEATKLMAVDFKFLGAIEPLYFASQCLTEEATEEKDPVDRAKVLCPDRSYEIIVRKGCAYGSILKAPIVCIYDHDRLIINHFRFNPGNEDELFGKYGFRSTISSRDVHFAAILGALVEAAIDKKIVPRENPESTLPTRPK